MILQNIVDLTKTCQDLKKEGHKIQRECLERLSPYLTEQYKRFWGFFFLSTMAFLYSDDIGLPWMPMMLKI